MILSGDGLSMYKIFYIIFILLLLALLAIDEDQQTVTDQLQRILNNWTKWANWTKRWKIRLLVTNHVNYTLRKSVYKW